MHNISYMIVGRSAARAGWMVVGAGALALQIVAAGVSGRPPGRPGPVRRILRGQGPAGAGGQLLRLPCGRTDGRPAPRFARSAAQGRPIGPGARSRRSRQEPADPGRPADQREAEDAEGRPAEARRDRGAGRMGAGWSRRGPPPRSTTTDDGFGGQARCRDAQRRPRLRTSSRRSSGRSGRFSRCARRRRPPCRTRRGRRPTSIASCWRASSTRA